MAGHESNGFVLASISKVAVHRLPMNGLKTLMPCSNRNLCADFGVLHGRSQMLVSECGLNPDGREPPVGAKGNEIYCLFPLMSPQDLPYGLGQILHRSRSYLGEYFRRMRSRLGTPAAITAAAHKLARVLYQTLRPDNPMMRVSSLSWKKGPDNANSLV